jgi:hypothetical protein
MNPPDYLSMRFPKRRFVNVGCLGVIGLCDGARHRVHDAGFSGSY